MKTLVVLLFLLASSELTQAQPAEVRPAEAQASPENFKFEYYSNEGSIQLSCVHQAKPIEPDFYQIVCGKGTNIRKNFEAKFRVRRLGPNSKLFYEVVYWVTDRNLPERYDHGTTMMLHLNSGSIQNFSLHQEVENSYAALVVRFTP